MHSMQAFNEQSGAPYKLNISAGSASFEIEQGCTPDLAALMVEADSKLYHMKRSKKGLP
jgi:GGDEF domain-containing protein